MNTTNEILYADGFEDALIGTGIQFNTKLAVYDYDICVQILMDRDDMTQEDAEEYMDYNVTGAWVGDNTPVFIRLGLNSF